MRSQKQWIKGNIAQGVPDLGLRSNLRPTPFSEGLQLALKLLVRANGLALIGACFLSRFIKVDISNLSTIGKTPVSKEIQSSIHQHIGMVVWQASIYRQPHSECSNRED